MNTIYDRSINKLYEENIPKSLSFFYNNFIGRIILKILITKPISRLAGIYMDSKLSKLKIRKFIKKNNIDMSEYQKENYMSFNDFFIRTIKVSKRKKDKNKFNFISPADSRLSVYKIDKNTKFKIKNSIYTVSELIKDKELAKEYKNGYCLVFRLSVDDYHHYSFTDDGILISQKEINGVLHTVNPIASKKYKVYSENNRVVSVLSTRNFGKIVYVEVGALMVGKIKNKIVNKFKKCDEKGYFCFGGSTVVILVKQNIIELDEDILKYSKKDIEVKVKMYEKIGKKVGE